MSVSRLSSDAAKRANNLDGDSLFVSAHYFCTNISIHKIYLWFFSLLPMFSLSLSKCIKLEEVNISFKTCWWNQKYFPPLFFTNMFTRLHQQAKWRQKKEPSGWYPDNVQLNLYLAQRQEVRMCLRDASPPRKEAAVTSDQEAHHSCFPDLISAARAKSPLGSQFSFLLIGTLIRLEKSTLYLPTWKLDTVAASLLPMWVCFCMWNDGESGEKGKKEKKS